MSSTWIIGKHAGLWLTRTKDGHLCSTCSPPYLCVDLFVLVTGDGHDVRPVCGLHYNTSQVRTSDMEGGGAVLVRTLDARPTDLLCCLVAVDALLQENNREEYCRTYRKGGLLCLYKNISLLIILNDIITQFNAHFIANYIGNELGNEKG